MANPREIKQKKQTKKNHLHSYLYKTFYLDGILAPPFMKSKQLANVLIKILGISLFVHAIPGFLSGFFMELLGFYTGPSSSAVRSSAASYSLTYPIASGLAGIVSFAVAIVLIVKSRKIAEYLFSEDE